MLPRQTKYYHSGRLIFDGVWPSVLCIIMESDRRILLTSQWRGEGKHHHSIPLDQGPQSLLHWPLNVSISPVLHNGGGPGCHSPHFVGDDRACCGRVSESQRE